MNPRFGCLGVPGDVRERLLADTEYSCRKLAIHRQILAFVQAAYLRSLLKIVRHPFDRRIQAEGIENRGAQLGGDPSDIRDRRVYHSSEIGKAVCQRLNRLSVCESL